MTDVLRRISGRGGRICVRFGAIFRPEHGIDPRHGVFSRRSPARQRLTGRAAIDLTALWGGQVGAMPPLCPLSGAATWCGSGHHPSPFLALQLPAPSCPPPIPLFNGSHTRWYLACMEPKTDTTLLHNGRPFLHLKHFSGNQKSRDNSVFLCVGNKEYVLSYSCPHRETEVVSVFKKT